MKVLSQSPNTLCCASGSWRIWSLSDGYVDLPAESLKHPGNKVGRQIEPPQRDASLVRLSVNCFLFDRSGMDRVLIDCGAGGSWDPSMGHLVEAMAEAGIDASSVTMIALTHAHGDHINGLLMPDGRRAFNDLRKIVIGEDAVEEFLAEPVLEQFRSLLAPINGGDRLAEHLLAVDIPGHARGHMGYLLNADEDDVLFCGDLIHVPAAQFSRPDLTWTYDDDEAVARATRIKLLQDAANAQTWLAGAHLGRPGIGRVVEEGRGYAFIPVA
ncbi:MBL fold metallo-hydrolase [Bradyrhizobium sp. Arg816]|uniref:MBL fold metallo-hydrolase n=1 Tax=Bradyrhizobium sp. Arg816 TaxID=2998491 RepID=UPI00249F5EF9|nr:MBL fold metallo-hydrolase [Bradyrhizobium sp. Arg816]MDI3559137.1 MBL fold metallo-hydrolase [Bradyrhizobium sp. Arg816]